tara:strand:- start:12085 stop:12291 length:207 start_codon:yes stop_codon:yes gene_type:complete
MIDLRKIFRRKNTVEIEPLTVDELFEDKLKENTDPDIMCENALIAMIEEYEEERVLSQDTIDGPHERG